MKKYIRFFLVDRKEPYQGFGEITDLGIRLCIDSGIYQGYPWWRIKECLVVEEEFVKKGEKMAVLRNAEDMETIANLLVEGKSIENFEYNRPTNTSKIFRNIIKKRKGKNG